MRRLPVLALLTLTACSTTGGSQAHRPDVIPLTAALSAAPTASGPAWPQAGHDARRSGTGAALGPTTGRLRWTRTLEGNVTPGPVVGLDGTIIAASNAGILHGLDPATGQDRWSFDSKGTYGSDLSTSPAVLPDGTVLWPGPHDTLWALDAGGHLLWQQTFRGQPTSPAVAEDGHTVVVADQQGHVTSLQVEGAQHRTTWSVDLGGSGYSSVALDPHDPSVAYTTVGSDLVAVHAGRVAWRFATKDLVEVSPAVAPDGTIVVGSNDRYEYALQPDGKLAWRYQKSAQTYSSPVVDDDGIAWFGDHRAFVNGVDVATGRLVARFRGESVEPKGSPSVGVWSDVVVDAHHDVYWGTRLGHVYGESADGHRLFDLPTRATVDSYPALTADGLLVVGVTDGRLLGIADH